MTKRQAENLACLYQRAESIGLDRPTVNTLLRIERTLQRWGERECGDGSDWCIERDEATGKPFNVYHGPGKSRRYPVADRERGALKRAEKIAKERGLVFFHQGDCRGCAVYVGKPEQVTGPIESCYTNLLAICY